MAPVAAPISPPTTAPPAVCPWELCPTIAPRPAPAAPPISAPFPALDAQPATPRAVAPNIGQIRRLRINITPSFHRLKFSVSSITRQSDRQEGLPAQNARRDVIGT